MILKKTFKNSIFAVSSYITIGILTFIIRKLFLISLNDLFLGYEGLFGNIIEAITITNFGLDIIIYYRIENAYGRDDKKSAGELFDFYKKYTIINCLLVFLITIVVIGFLYFQALVTLEVLSIFFILLITYYLQLFISIYRMLLIIAQDDYLYTVIDFTGQFISLIVRMMIIIHLKNYLVYLLCSTFVFLLEFVIIRKIVTRKYVGIFAYGIKRDYYGFIKKEGILFDIRNNIVQKTSLVVYGATDNILIALIFGIQQVSQLSNYYLLSAMYNNALMRITDPFQAAIGKIVNSETDDNDKVNLFNAFNCIGFILACLSVLFSLTVFNDFIVLFFGYKYKADYWFVVFFALNQYVTWNHKFLAYYRNLFGKYEIDKPYIVIGTILNIALSIILSIGFGVSGIIIGTFVSHLSFWIGRAVVVFKTYLKENALKYIKNQIVFLVLAMLEVGILSVLFYQPVGGVLQLVLRSMMGLTISILIALLGLGLTNNIYVIPLILHRIKISHEK